MQTRTFSSLSHLCLARSGFLNKDVTASQSWPLLFFSRPGTSKAGLLGSISEMVFSGGHLLSLPAQHPSLFFQEGHLVVSLQDQAVPTSIQFGWDRPHAQPMEWDYHLGWFHWRVPPTGRVTGPGMGT